MPRIPGPRAVIYTIIGVLIAGIALWLPPSFPWSPFYPCDDGLRAVGPACIGVSDRSDFGDPSLATVMSRIAAENDSVTGPFYTVGFQLPLEAESERTSESAELRYELEGAHLAQLRTNRTSEIEGGGPKIKLVVGNAGDDNTYWREVVDEFHQMAAGPERLRAVAGIGNSIDATKQAIAELTRPVDGGEPIAVIGARMTADSLSLDPSNRRIDGFFRVAPTNTDEARAAAAHIRDRGYRRPVLLRDINELDTYSATLGQAFREAFGPTRGDETFDSGKDGLPGALTGIVRNLCVQRPDAVYFAGRGEPLEQFVDVLANRPCQELAVDIVTGDDISGIEEPARAGDVGVRTALSNLNLTYTAIAHPDMWDAEELRGSYSAGAIAYFRQDCAACFSVLFPGEPLDEAAIMGHDAILLAVTAIRRAGLTTDSGTQDVSPSAVIQMLAQVRGVNSVAGASGDLSMSPCGDPEHKLFPILSLEEDGTARLVGPATAGHPLAC